MRGPVENPAPNTASPVQYDSLQSQAVMAGPVPDHSPQVVLDTIAHVVCATTRGETVCQPFLAEALGQDLCRYS